MKKIGFICAAVLLCGSLTGCGNQSKNSSKNSAKISSLKAKNSSLKAKKHSDHKNSKHNKEDVIDRNSSSTTKNSNSSNNGSKNDPKEVDAAKHMREYDPEWWDSLSPEEQQYWAHHTAYGSNEDFMYAPGLYEKHMGHQQTIFSPDNSNANNNNGEQSTSTPTPGNVN